MMGLKMHSLLRELLYFVSRIYPFYSGCGTLANTFLYRLASSSPELVETTIRSGPRIKVHIDDYVGRSIFYFGDLDPKISWILQKVLKPGDIMLDIGSNYGLVALHAAQLVGPQGIIHAFEPQQTLAKLIAESASLNHFKNICIHPIGLSSSDKKATIFIPEGNRGMGSIGRQHAQSNSTEIELKSASHYLDHLNLGRVKLIKIDVEGHELEIFKGSQLWLARNKPEAIIFENNSSGPNSHQVLNLLQEQNYSFFGLSKSLTNVSLRPITPEIAHEYNDILAIHDDSRLTLHFASQTAA